MIARVFILVPFHMTVPEGEHFIVPAYNFAGYKVLFYPPMRSEKAPSKEESGELKVDGVPAFQADVLKIDFCKESFDRRGNEPRDPPTEVIQNVVNSFLTRLRYVGHAAQVRPMDFQLVTCKVQYLNDDGSELEKVEGLIRGYGSFQFSISWMILNKKIWEDVHSLSFDYAPPPWEDLLLDAKGQLPNIGTSIVLATTALEVFIATVLDQMAAHKNVPSELWSWINGRDDWRQQPTLAEQYDVLLKFYTGFSLKEDVKLWELFNNLRKARNSFVHEGYAKIGKAKELVSIELAKKLILGAGEIFAKVREVLPKEFHWPQFKHSIKIEASKKILIGPPPPSDQPQP